MRILHLIPNLSGGGAEKQLNYLAPLLVALGHDVHIAYYHNGPHDVTLPGVTLHRLSLNSNYDPRILFQLNKLVRRLRPDLVQTWILQMDIFGGIVAFLNRVPWVLREPSSRENYPPGWKTRLRLKLGSRAAAVISNSAGGDAYWSGRLPAHKRFVIRNGVPVSAIEKAEQQLTRHFNPENKPMLLYVGRLSADASANKNLSCLLDAISVVSQDLPFLTILCGDGPQRGELESLSEKKGLRDYLVFTGYLNALHVWSLMKNATAMISLSAYEGCPNAVMEGMVAGTPLVLSDIEAHRALLNNGSALFVDPHDTQQVASSIRKVILEKNTREDMAARAKTLTGQWSNESMSIAFEKVYQNAIKK